MPERVVSPYTAALVIEYYPQQVTRNLREMVRRGGTVPPPGYEGKRWGLRDAYDLESKTWDERYLSLDQSMLFLSLANYLHDQIVRQTYTNDPLIAKGLELIEPYRKRNSMQAELWRKRDGQVLQLTAAEKSAVGAVIVDEIPLDRNSVNENSHQFQVSTDSGCVLTAFNKTNQEGELLNIFRFPQRDISSLERLELDIEIVAINKSDPGYLRVYLEDRFQQKRYAYIKLDKNVHTYSIPARDLAGILLDESAVQALILSLHYSPWYHTNKRMLATRGILKINAIRLISSE